MNTKRWVVIFLVGLMTMIFTGTAAAAEFVGDDNVYRLASGDVIEDDLYVGAGEIFIDGTVMGDLIATGGYIEVNGTVTGDALLMGGGIKITGDVEDDLRAAGAGIEISGTIGDDLIVAGGGNPGFSVPIQMGSRSITQGVMLMSNARVGGDAVVVGGLGNIGGDIGGDLFSAMGSLNLSAQVAGDATIEVQDFQVNENGRVAGTLTYRSESELNIPAQVSERVEFEQITKNVEEVSSFSRFGRWFVRTLLLLVGFALLGWLLMRVAPELLTKPAAALQADPGKSALYGFLAAVLFLFFPVASGIIVALIGLFWGIFPAIVTFFVLFSGLAIVWIFSPLVTGLWLGKRFMEAPLTALLVGVLVLVIVGRIPVVGWFVYLLSFILALGGCILSWRSTSVSKADAVIA